MLGIVGFAILHLFSVIIVEAFIHLLYGHQNKYKNKQNRKAKCKSTNIQLYRLWDSRMQKQILALRSDH